MTTIAFDPAYKDALITLYGQDFTAGGGASLKSALASAAQSGKIYFEYQCSSVGAEELFGVANDSAALTTSLASNTNGIGVNNQGGADVYYNGGTVGTFFSGWGNGDIMGFAASTSDNKVWGLKSGTWRGGGGSPDPATNTSGITLGVSGNIRPGVSINGGFHALGLGNFPPFLGGATFGEGVVPSGFSMPNTGLSSYTAGVSSLNPSELSTQATLVQSNLRLIGNSGITTTYQLCVGTKIIPANSKSYFEVRVDAANLFVSQSAQIGIRRTGFTLNNSQIDNGTNVGLEFNAGSGTVKANGSTLATLSEWRYVGSCVGVATNTYINKIWFRINGTWDGDPAAGTGGYSIASIRGAGAIYAAAGVHGNIQTNALGLNFGGYVFQGSLPSGFVSLDDAQEGGGRFRSNISMA